MTAAIVRLTPLTDAVASRFKVAYAGLLHALDVFAEARMRSAVPESQLRKAERRMKRGRRLIRAADSRKQTGR